MVNHSGNKKIVLKSASDRSCQWEKLELSFMVQYNSVEKNGSEISCYGAPCYQLNQVQNFSKVFTAQL